MNMFNVIIEAIADSFVKLLDKFKVLVLALYDKVIILYKNKNEIDAKYDPIIQNKSKLNSELISKINSMNNENKIIEKNIEALKKENLDFQKKIKQLQQLLVDNHRP